MLSFNLEVENLFLYVHKEANQQKGGALIVKAIMNKLIDFLIRCACYFDLKIVPKWISFSRYDEISDLLIFVHGVICFYPPWELSYCFSDKLSAYTHVFPIRACLIEEFVLDNFEDELFVVKAGLVPKYYTEHATVLRFKALGGLGTSSVDLKRARIADELLPNLAE